jgi:hypothetical protein
MTRPHFPPHTSLTQTHISSTRSVDSPLSTENGQSILFSEIHSLLLPSQQKLDNPEAPQQSKPGPAPVGDPIDDFPAPPTQIRTPSSQATSFTLDPRRPKSSVSTDSEDGDGASFYDNYRYSRLSIPSKLSKSSGYTVATIPLNFLHRSAATHKVRNTPCQPSSLLNRCHHHLSHRHPPLRHLAK